MTRPAEGGSGGQARRLSRRRLSFTRSTSADSWYAWANLADGRGMLIEAAHADLPSGGLVPVDDLGPFLAGHRELLEQHTS